MVFKKIQNSDQNPKAFGLTEKRQFVAKTG
jgi:hypothetical protein